MVTLQRCTSDHPEFHALVRKLDKDLLERYAEEQATYDQFNKIENNATVLLAFAGDIAVGCSCLKRIDESTVEIKRMYVLPEHRGKGIGAVMMAELTAWAQSLGFKTIILETGIRQPEAIALYQKAGFTSIEKYGPYVNMPNSVCMAKHLA